MLNIGPNANNSLKVLAYLQHNGIEIKMTGYNSFGSYEYATLPDILGAIQPTLAKFNCVVCWSEDNHINERVASEGDYYIHTDVITTCKIVYIEDTEDYIETTSHGYGINKNADKTCKATTISKRYSLTNLLGLKNTGDDDTDTDVGLSTSTPKSNSSTVPKTSFRERMKQRSTQVKRDNSDMIV